MFLFIDDLGLTLIYIILFVYIRFHAKRFRAATTNESQASRSHELQERRTSETSSPTTFKFADQKGIKPHPVSVQFDGSLRNVVTTNSTHRRMNKVAYSLLFYPFLYIFHTLPLAILRVANFVGTTSSYSAVYFAASIYCCSGWTTVLLYTATRKGIISWDWFPRWLKGRSTQDRGAPVV